MSVYADEEKVDFFDDMDEFIYFEGAQPIVVDPGVTYAPASAIKPLMKYLTAVEIYDDSVVLRQDGFEYDTAVRVRVGDNTMYVNDIPIPIENTPFIRDGEIYIPFRAVAEALEYDVVWEENNIITDGNLIYVYYNTAFIYVWNEDKDSSESGVRYAAFQKYEENRTLDEIKSRAVTDFNEITSKFTDISKGYLSVCFMYKIDRYKIPRNVHEAVTMGFVETEIICGSYDECLDEIPDIIEGTGEYSDAWFSEQLFALGEGDLRKGKSSVYRFTCIPSFVTPYSIRVEVYPDGGKAYYSECDAPIGAYGGDKSEYRERKLSKAETDGLLSLLDTSNFWNIPTVEEDNGVDGFEYIIEAVDENGVYHLVERWTPYPDTIYYKIGEYFKALAKTK